MIGDRGFAALNNTRTPASDIKLNSTNEVVISSCEGTAMGKYFPWYRQKRDGS